MKSFFRMTYPYILWIALFVVAPMIMILLYAFTKDGGNRTLIFRFTLDNFIRFFQDPTFTKVLLTSLRIALMGVVLGGLLLIGKLNTFAYIAFGVALLTLGAAAALSPTRQKKLANERLASEKRL